MCIRILEFVLTIKDHVKGAVKEEYLVKDKNEKTTSLEL
ncbi:hypothetical protein LEP1GSC062_1127 [Leptospira alexanderi serovar Manhao 3 str. L 60]|uniref:Uncharacterized protein n=1 Tax=Leptospira alexanderi serovar Manhao 3 str. L 60 TaxID=1049759 RepID=V6HYB3_9LEPT|nr:hypothetical protein LEP1GSC062_1127 [Leptospira alexanderi serovar Manhao 3 str. L 60]